MQSYINQEGVAITPKGMAEISQRFEEKEALLAEMRTEREAQYAHRHSHVGVEIGLDIKELSSLLQVYQGLADTANWCARAGYDQAGRTFYSLANGVIRAAVQIHGSGTAQMFTGLIDATPVTVPTKTPAKVAPENQSPEYREARARYEAGQGNNPDYFGTDDAPGAPADSANAHMMAGSDEGMVYDEKGGLLAQARTPLAITDDRTVEQLEADGDVRWPDNTPYIPKQSPDDVAAAIRGDFPDDNNALDEAADDEPSHALEPAASPEPTETVQRQRAQERRRQRQAARQAAS